MRTFPAGCFFLCLLCLLVAPPTLAGETLSPFTSDGCSSFPDGPPQEPEKWRECCVRHDRAYWLGGTWAERRQADRELQECVARVENRLLAETMWAGVRVGGSPFWPTPFRWGFGWSTFRGYRALTPEERRRAEVLLRGAQDQRNHSSP